MKRYLILIGLLILAAAATTSVRAQSASSPTMLADYDLTWSSIDGGGGSSTGGVYTLNGTIGQTDAGSLSGGGYTLSGGFWVGAASVLMDQFVYLPLVLK